MPKINKEILEHRVKVSNDFTGLEKRYILNRLDGEPEIIEIPEALNPSSDDFGMMLCGAVRYALGRMSYITGTTANYVEKYLTYLSDSTLQNINKDITHAQMSNNLGMTCDRVIWIGLRDAIQAEIQRRKDDRGVE